MASQAGLITAASVLVAGVTTQLALNTADELIRFYIVLAGSCVLYPVAFLSLSYVATARRQTQQQTQKASKPDTSRKPQADDKTIRWVSLATRFTGFAATTCSMSLPLFLPQVCPKNYQPLADGFLRVLTSYYALRMFDITVVRPERAPQWKDDVLRAQMAESFAVRLRYVYRLCLELRYRSFDIAVPEAGRDTPSNSLWFFGPLVLLPLLMYLLPIAEIKALFALLMIYLGLEGIHAPIVLSMRLVNPAADPLRPLFFQPFAATSMTDFWRVHWHQGANSWLYTLGYRPAYTLTSKFLGRTAGKTLAVLATFSLSGVWHAWVAAALSRKPWQTALGMWGLFMAFGGVCLLEGALKKGHSRSLVQKVVVWAVVTEVAAMFERHLEANANVVLPFPIPTAMGQNYTMAYFR